MTIAEFGSIALAFVTTISLIYVSRQVNATRLQTKGEFLVALDRQLADYTEIGLKLVRNRQMSPTRDEWLEIIGYLGVFERMNIMVEDDILDIDMVDRLFGSRLILLLTNNAIYDMVQSSGAEWQDFIHLCRLIADHRQQVHVADYDQAFIDLVGKLTPNAIVSSDLWSSRLNG
jgi:hypothetical protein